jgi:hypothetical protein
MIQSSMQGPGVTTARFPNTYNTYIVIMDYKSIVARDITQLDQRTKAKTVAVSWLVHLPISRRAVFRK